MAFSIDVRRRAAFCRALLLGATICGCAATGQPEASASSLTAPRPRVWDYRVLAAPGARELMVQVDLPPGVPAELGVDAFADPFLTDLEIAVDRGWRALARTGRRWLVPRCRAAGCSLRYRYRLGEAAEHIDRFAYAGYRSGALLAPPSTFLLAPQDYAGSDLYRFSVGVASGESFVSGVWRDPSGRGYSAPASLLFQAPYSGFARFELERMVLGQDAGEGSSRGTLTLAIAPGEAALRVTREGLRAAVRRAAAAVSGYYGRFPVPEVTLIVLPSAGDTTAGMQLGNGGATIVFFLGVDVDDAALGRDWVLSHELLHLGFPTLGRRHLWLAEGLATYQGPIARARAGLIDERELWRSFLDGMSKGLANDTDGGLDGSTRWGRTYWGGALFCLLLDVELRAHSDNHLSLDVAARAILRAGGDTSVRWSVARTLAAGDAVLDRPALRELYAEHSTRAVRVDLPALFRRLGVRRDGARVMLDDRAELAHVRRAIGSAETAAADGARPTSEQRGGRRPQGS
jgi:hypothetical protein